MQTMHKTHVSLPSFSFTNISYTNCSNFERETKKFFLVIFKEGNNELGQKQ